MTPTARRPLAVRVLEALAGAEREPRDPEPPSMPSARGARCAGLVRSLCSLAERLAGRVAGAGRVAAPLARRPLPAAAAAVALLPLARFALPDAAAPIATSALLAALGMIVLLAAAAGMHDARDHPAVFGWLLAGAVLRLALGGAVHLGGGFPDEHGFYHPIAAAAAGSWEAGLPGGLPDHPVVVNRAAYFHLLSLTYLATGAEMLAGRVLGGLIGLGVALLAGELARAWAGPRAAVAAVAVLALHPEHALWSTTLARDSLTALLVLAALVLVARSPGRLHRGLLLLAAAPAALLAQNAFVIAGALAATLAACTLAEVVAAGRTRAGRAVRGVLAAAAALALLGVIGDRWGQNFSPEMFSAVRATGTGLAPDILPDLRFTHPLEIALFAPLGAACMLLAPFPWAAVHFERFAYGLLALPGLAITLLGVSGIAAVLRRRASAAAPAVLFVLLALAILGALESNAGIVVRHRLPVTAVLACGAAALLAGSRIGDPDGAPTRGAA